MTKIHNLLEKRKREVHGIAHDATVAEAARAFRAKDISSLIVLDGGRVVGMFTKNDLTRCCAERPDELSKARVGDFMERDVFMSSPEADLEEVVRTMVAKGIHHVPVREGEDPVGRVSFQDLLAHECGRLHGAENELLCYIQGIY